MRFAFDFSQIAATHLMYTKQSQAQRMRCTVDCSLSQFDSPRCFELMVRCDRLSVRFGVTFSLAQLVPVQLWSAAGKSA